jgi:hypothetical protein
MSGITHTPVTVAVALSLGICGLMFGADPPQKPKPAKSDLTADSFADLHKLIRPHEDEWRHLKVEWLTDVVAARKKAASEDKPIIICYTGGAGYNEPLGTC